MCIEWENTNSLFGANIQRGSEEIHCTSCKDKDNYTLQKKQPQVTYPGQNNPY